MSESEDRRWEIRRHAEKANQVLASIHGLCIGGTADIRDKEWDGDEEKFQEWDYQWPLLLELVTAIAKMKTVAVCEAETSYNGCWTRQESGEISLPFDGSEGTSWYRGVLSARRSGPGLEELTWDWAEAVEQGR
jgi:hypothetical protein